MTTWPRAKHYKWYGHFCNFHLQYASLPLDATKSYPGPFKVLLCMSYFQIISTHLRSNFLQHVPRIIELCITSLHVYAVTPKSRSDAYTGKYWIWLAESTSNRANSDWPAATFFFKLMSKCLWSQGHTLIFWDTGYFNDRAENTVSFHLCRSLNTRFNS